MNSKGFPWWGWVLIAAGVSGSALDLNWFAAFAWNVGSGAATEAIEFVDGSNGRPTQPTLPVEE